jgi:hypothetical protein
VRTSAEGVAQANQLASKVEIPTSALVQRIHGAKAHGVRGDGFDAALPIDAASAAEVRAVQPNGESSQNRVKLSRPDGDDQTPLPCDRCGRFATPERGPVVPGGWGNLHAGCREEVRERRRYEGLDPPSKTGGKGSSPPSGVLDPTDPQSVAEARQRLDAVAARWDALKGRLVPPELNAEKPRPRDLSFKIQKEGEAWRAKHPAFLGFVAEASTRPELDDKLRAVVANRFRVPASEVTVAPNLPVAAATAIPH